MVMKSVDKQTHMENAQTDPLALNESLRYVNHR